MTRFENVGRYPSQPVSVVGHAFTLSPSFLLAQANFESNLFPYKYSNIFKPSHPLHLPAYEDGTECSETSAYKIQTPGELPRRKHRTNIVEPGRPRDSTAHALYMLDDQELDTLRICNNYCFSTATVVTRTRLVLCFGTLPGLLISLHTVKHIFF
jgi:hypothetical protein